MATAQAYRGTTYTVPATDDEDWGDQVTAQLLALLKGGDVGEFTSVALNVVKKDPVGADLSLAAGATITWTHNVHIVKGTSAPITVDATTGISAGQADKQKLILEGGDATNTVRLNHAGTVNVNGACVLGLGHWIELRWSVADTEWVERNRSH